MGKNPQLCHVGNSNNTAFSVLWDCPKELLRSLVLELEFQYCEGKEPMRFSLRTLLILLTLAAVGLAAWQMGTRWGEGVTCVLAAVLFVWAVGPRRLGKLEAPVATARWLARNAQRKRTD